MSVSPTCLAPNHLLTATAMPPPHHFLALPRWSSHLLHSVNCLQCLLSRPTRTRGPAETAPTIRRRFAVKGRRHHACVWWNRPTCARRLGASRAAAPPPALVWRRSDDSRTGAADFMGYRGNCLLWTFRPCTSRRVSRQYNNVSH